MLNITRHMKRSGVSNKMDGMISINTLPKLNPFCLKMRESKENICFACYCKRSEQYPNLQKSYAHNTEMLSSHVLTQKELPVIEHLFCRFNAFGELMNKTHAKNLYTIARYNPAVTFTLWTKRPELLKGLKKPDNMILIYSSPKKNVEAELPAGFNKVFTVFNKEYLREHSDVTINCGAKNCLTCHKCYSLNDTDIFIREKLKA